jgi:epoxyqueuosine reductase QueG
MRLEELFNRYEVPLWGTASLGEAIGGGGQYRFIAFCLPYHSAAISALPDDNLMDECRKELSAKTKAVYSAIQDEFAGWCWESYHEVDRKLNLRESGISQKVLAHLAGLGWIGRSSLLITPELGPRVRLGTIFTANDLEPIGTPYACDCGDCMLCSEICPIGAIGDCGYDVRKCRQVVTDARGEYKTFCGLCMQICPQGSANYRAT